MVVPAFHRFDQIGHDLAGDTGVLELVAAGPDGHVEPVEVGAVVDRKPVVADVVQIDDALLLVRNAERRHATAGPQHLGVPLILGEVLVVVVGIHELLRITIDVGPSDQHVVARLGAVVEADVVVCTDDAIGKKVHTRRRRDVVHLVTQCRGLDVHRVVDARHLVEDRAVGAGDVDDDRRVDGGAVGQRHSGDPPIVPVDRRDLGLESELGARGFGGSLEVVARELRVGDVPGIGAEQRTGEGARRVAPEVGIVRASGWAVQAVIHPGPPFGHLIARQQLVRNVELIPELLHPGRVVLLVPQKNHLTDLAVLDQPELILHADVIGPVLPVVAALPGEVDALDRAVGEANDRAGVDGRPGARGIRLVDVEGAIPAARHLDRDRTSDDPRADDDDVVAAVRLTHSQSFAAGQRERPVLNRQNGRP